MVAKLRPEDSLMARSAWRTGGVPRRCGAGHEDKEGTDGRDSVIPPATYTCAASPHLFHAQVGGHTLSTSTPRFFRAASPSVAIRTVNAPESQSVHSFVAEEGYDACPRPPLVGCGQVRSHARRAQDYNVAVSCQL